MYILTDISCVNPQQITRNDYITIMDTKDKITQPGSYFPKPDTISLVSFLRSNLKKSVINGLTLKTDSNGNIVQIGVSGTSISICLSAYLKSHAKENGLNKDQMKYLAEKYVASSFQNIRNRG